MNFKTWKLKMKNFSALVRENVSSCFLRVHFQTWMNKTNDGWNEWTEWPKWTELNERNERPEWNDHLPN